ncbi:MAG: hypothetical protein ABJD11_01815, partial [Gemmatimonadota bacterium]
MPLSFLHDIVRSIADFLNIESGALTRGFVRIVTIWVGAWLAHRAIRVMARRIIEAVDDGDDTTMTLREKRG